MNTRLLALLVLISFIAYGQAYYFGKCRECNMATSLDDCVTWADCGTAQACYMEEVITESFQKRFNGGCRPINVCQGQGKKKRSDYVACSKCCNNDDFCNEHLCGIKRGSNLTLCNTCDGGLHPPPTKYPEDCKLRKTCQSDEMCFSSTYTHGDNSLRHKSNCRKKSECILLVKYILNLEGQRDVGKRDNQICAVCCGDDMCNDIACEAIKGRLINLDGDGWLDKNTLKEII